jgi:hypothetical protein
MAGFRGVLSESRVQHEKADAGFYSSGAHDQDQSPDATKKPGGPSPIPPAFSCGACDGRGLSPRGHQHHLLH